MDCNGNDDDDEPKSREEEQEQDEEDDESDDEIMMDDTDDAEQLMFDFEALPLCEADKAGIVDLLTQIFLRADVDVDGIASALVRQSPFGCVFRPAEEMADEDNEDIVFGILSMLPLNNSLKYENNIWQLLRSRAQKYASDKGILSKLDEMSSSSGERRVGLLLNERMLHFPASIASPAFTSLKQDLEKNGNEYRFDDVIMFQKIRIADSDINNSGIKKKKKKRKKKNKKKANNNQPAISPTNIIFDNPEEQLLFTQSLQVDEKVIYFDYPVQSDVEKESKFNALIIKGITYRPYRRVCLLNRKQFQSFMNSIIQQK